MEVIDNKRTTGEPTALAAGCDPYGTQARKRGDQSSSFDCDPSAMDLILGLRGNGCAKRRLDIPESRLTELASTKLASTESQWGPPCHTGDADSKQERLLRLLGRQQAWYDAAQQAALAAEQLLLLCEHHQQQWLQPNQQSPPSRQ